METPNYKETIHLPKTSFSMKANLPVNEPKTLEFWDKIKVYEKRLKLNSGSQDFSMPDGPPYANGNIHLGHVLNKVLKDIVIKFRLLQGRKAPFIPGWDCHGLPIEHKVTKALGSKRKDMTKAQIRELCRQEALKWVGKQKEQFQRLGILADWENPYLTLQPAYEAAEVRVLAKALDNGVFSRGEKPVFWCPVMQTALAEAEVEYQEKTSPSIYTEFPFTEEAAQKLSVPSNTSVLIWTTTPWTLAANYGLSFGEDFEYGLYPYEDKHLLFATELREQIENLKEIKLGEPLKTFKGKDFEHLKAKHPFLDRTSLCVLGHHVSLEAGTGVVHTAPAHGVDDYIIGKKYDLPIQSPVTGAGKYTNEVPEWEGEFIFKVNDKVIEKLRSLNLLYHHNDFQHSYPHNWRSKTPLIYRTTPQWFIKVDNEQYNIREEALRATENSIEFFPAWGKARLRSMLENRPDWCISRQRIWGVPIPVFYCKSCDEPFYNSEVMNKVADKMESSGHGIDAYFEAEPGEFLEGVVCVKCGSEDFRAGQDILDVWFDSGICHTAVQGQHDGLNRPADIYLEGSDQHRGWFQTSLISSLAAHKDVPFKALITHGFVTDQKGLKMSKSLGNVVDPLKEIQKSGAEILRLWVAYEDYGQDVNVGPQVFQRVSETYRRIRNTFRFLLGNLNDFDYKSEAVLFEDMDPIDRWALAELNTLVEKVTAAYKSYQINRVYHLVNEFFTVTLSSTYLDILKDRLYTEKKSGLKRRSSQSVLHLMVENLTGLLAPILSFLSEEVYQNYKFSDPESLFLTDFPQAQQAFKLSEKESLVWSRVFEVRSQVNKKLEDLRASKVIGSSLAARLDLTLPEKDLELFQNIDDKLLAEVFIVSALKLKAGDFNIAVAPAEGEKCPRCWRISQELTLQDHPTPGICPHCVEALS